MIIAILNQKGGTGKTTSALSLSSGLAYSEQKALLVDLDPQSHSTIGMGLDENGQSTASIGKVFTTRGHPIQELVSPTYIDNLDVAPAHISLAKKAEEMHTRIGKETYLRESLAHARGIYNFIILDCPPNLGILTVNALTAADLVIVPCQMSRYSLDGLSDLIDILQELSEAGLTDPSPDWRILLTMYDSRNKVTNDFILDQLEPFRDRLLETVIMKNESLNQAQIAQQAIFDYDPHSKGAENYKSLTNEILSYEQARTTQQ